MHHLVHRNGTSWEGRYKSTLVDNEHYFLTVSHYIELNTVRANMVNIQPNIHGQATITMR
jgi:putative transposase